MAGYSKTPLVKKPGIKPGTSLYVFNPPVAYPELVEDLPDGIRFLDSLSQNVDFVHLFVKERHELETLLIETRKLMAQNGAFS